MKIRVFSRTEARSVATAARMPDPSAVRDRLSYGHRGTVDLERTYVPDKKTSAGMCSRFPCVPTFYKTSECLRGCTTQHLVGALRRSVLLLYGKPASIRCHSFIWLSCSMVASKVLRPDVVQSTMMYSLVEMICYAFTSDDARISCPRRYEKHWLQTWRSAPH